MTFKTLLLSTLMVAPLLASHAPSESSSSSQSLQQIRERATASLEREKEAIYALAQERSALLKVKGNAEKRAEMHAFMAAYGLTPSGDDMHDFALLDNRMEHATLKKEIKKAGKNPLLQFTHIKRPYVQFLISRALEELDFIERFRNSDFFIKKIENCSDDAEKAYWAFEEARWQSVLAHDVRRANQIINKIHPYMRAYKLTPTGDHKADFEALDAAMLSRLETQKERRSQRNELLKYPEENMLRHRFFTLKALSDIIRLEFVEKWPRTLLENRGITPTGSFEKDIEVYLAARQEENDASLHLHAFEQAHNKAKRQREALVARGEDLFDPVYRVLLLEETDETSPAPGPNPRASQALSKKMRALARQERRAFIEKHGVESLQNRLMIPTLFQNRKWYGAHPHAIHRDELFDEKGFGFYDLNPHNMVAISEDGARIAAYSPTQKRVHFSYLGASSGSSLPVVLPEDTDLLNLYFAGNDLLLRLGQGLGKNKSGESAPWIFSTTHGILSALIPKESCYSCSIEKPKKMGGPWLIEVDPRLPNVSSTSKYASLTRAIFAYDPETHSVRQRAFFDKELNNIFYDTMGNPLGAIARTNAETNVIDLREGRKKTIFSLTASQAKDVKVLSWAPRGDGSLMPEPDMGGIILLDRTRTNFKVPLLHTFSRWGSNTTPLLNEEEMTALTGDVVQVFFCQRPGPLEVAGYLTHEGGVPKLHVRHPDEPWSRVFTQIDDLGLLAHDICDFTDLGEGRMRFVACDTTPHVIPHHHVLELNTQASQGAPLIAHLGLLPTSIPRERFASKLSPMSHMSYATSDGLRVNAYLTLPQGRSLGDGGAKLPLINLVHGGPHYNDPYAFHGESQFWASRGFGVFMPQFRGSTGFGKSFEGASDGRWDLAVRDTHEGVQHLLHTSETFDPARVVVMGCSFGGYATALSLLTYPQTYVCGVARNGIYDLPLELTRSPEFRDQFLGTTLTSSTDDAHLRELSPTHLAARAPKSTSLPPLLVVHGESDTVCPFIQGQDLVRAWPSASPLTFVSLPNQGHSLSGTMATRSAFALEELFLERTLGTPGEPGARTQVLRAQSNGDVRLHQGQEHLGL